MSTQLEIAGVAGVSAVEDRHGDEQAAPSNGPKFFDLERFLPIDLIRIHTKTADIPTVTDEQLRLYRKAAFEEAMRYSSLLVGPLQLITEHVKMHKVRSNISGMNIAAATHRHQKIKTKFQVMRPDVFFYGTGAPVLVPTEPGTRFVDIPMAGEFMGNALGGNCCAPCTQGNGSGANGARVMYHAGYACENDVPAGIVVGMLKYIAWQVQNPGDVYMNVRNSLNTGETSSRGTNNAAWASGALEVWTTLDAERF